MEGCFSWFRKRLLINAAPRCNRLLLGVQSFLPRKYVRQGWIALCRAGAVAAGSFAVGGGSHEENLHTARVLGRWHCALNSQQPLSLAAKLGLC